MDVKIERGLAPATGFAQSADETLAPGGDTPGDPLSSIAAATQEAQMLYELDTGIWGTCSAWQGKPRVCRRAHEAPDSLRNDRGLYSPR